MERTAQFASSVRDLLLRTPLRAQDILDICDTREEHPVVVAEQLDQLMPGLLADYVLRCLEEGIRPLVTEGFGDLSPSRREAMENPLRYFQTDDTKMVRGLVNIYFHDILSGATAWARLALMAFVAHGVGEYVIAASTAYIARCQRHSPNLLGDILKQDAELLRRSAELRHRDAEILAEMIEARRSY